MTKLVDLITEKITEGKSYRDIEHESGVNHVSISQYHKGTEPNGKNLAKLATYFRCDFWDLVKKDDEASLPAAPSHYPASPEYIALEREMTDLSLDELLEARLVLRKWKREKKQIV